MSTTGASIYSGTINTAGNLTGNGFALNSTGLKVANGLNSVTLDAASGTITANAGTIAGWTMSGTTLSKNNVILDSAGKIQVGAAANTSVYIQSAAGTSPTKTYVMWAGNNTPDSNAKFRVAADGTLYATGAIFGTGTTVPGYATSDSLTTTNTNVTNLGTTVGNQGTAIANKLTKSASVITSATNEIQGLNSMGITMFANGNASATAIPTAGARVVMNSLGILAFNSNSQSNSTGITFSLNASTGDAFFKGEVQATSGKFTGEVQASSGKFTGEVTATSGRIGSWNIDTTNGWISNGTTYFYGSSSDPTGNPSSYAVLDATKFGYFNGMQTGSGGYLTSSGPFQSISGNVNTATGALSVGLAKTILYSDGTIYANTLGVYSGASALAIRQVQAAASGTNSETGFLRVNASSRRFKKNIESLSEGPYLDIVDRLNPVSFIDSNETDLSPRAIGLIAEEVAEIEELTDALVPKDENGDPFAINYPLVGVVAVMAIKELKNKLDLINQRLDALGA